MKARASSNGFSFHRRGRRTDRWPRRVPGVSPNTHSAPHQTTNSHADNDPGSTRITHGRTDGEAWVQDCIRTHICTDRDACDHVQSVTAPFTPRGQPSERRFQSPLLLAPRRQHGLLGRQRPQSESAIARVKTGVATCGAGRILLLPGEIEVGPNASPVL